jgi:hypothetical protein
MIDVNSNCSRVDAVKAAANQLKLMSSAASASPATPDAPANAAARKVKSDLQAVDAQVKSGDAKKAELALAAAEKDVSAAETAAPRKPSSENLRTLDAYA